MSDQIKPYVSIVLAPNEPDARVIDAANRANQALAEADEARARGENEKADTLYARHQFWRDAYNRLTA